MKKNEKLFDLVAKDLMSNTKIEDALTSLIAAKDNLEKSLTAEQKAQLKTLEGAAVKYHNTYEQEMLKLVIEHLTKNSL